jgi:hypothetical protein
VESINIDGGDVDLRINANSVVHVQEAMVDFHQEIFAGKGLQETPVMTISTGAEFGAPELMYSTTKITVPATLPASVSNHPIRTPLYSSIHSFRHLKYT